MRYLLKQKLLAIGDDFAVVDQNGNQAFYFDGKVVLFGKKIIVKSPSGQVLAIIQKKLGSFSPTFVIRQEGRELAKVYKKLFSFRNTFVIDVPGPDDITVVGRLVEHDYRFLLNGQEVAEVSKKWFTGKDTYGVDIKSNVEPLLVLSAAVIIDLLCHPKRDSGF